jgi:peptide/nickel transport system permease protein
MFKNIKEIFRYPSVIFGSVIILGLAILGIIAIITIPYNKAVSLWRGSEADWYQNPKTAGPTWLNWFRKDKLPTTIDIQATDPSITKTVADIKDGKEITITIPFEYTADDFADDMSMYFISTFDSEAPFISMTVTAPNGTVTPISGFSIDKKFTYRFDQDKKLTKKLRLLVASKGLFTDFKGDRTKPMKGKYLVTIDAITFDKNTDVNAELIVYGKLSGWAGTDTLRRDLGIALLWGTPIALMFGLLAAVGTSLMQLIIAGISAWFGGWVDTLLQRITEVNLVLPFLPILMMIGTFYSRSIFVILTAVILLSIFGQGILTFRAVFMQVKESPYIEAAKSYGASNTRIIFQYMVPRLIPMLIPQFIVLIPSYVFLEASLAILGLGDPTLPTWGKIIQDAEANGALFQGWYYWVIEPSILLMLTGLAFSVVGYALDRVFNPRLRGQ